MEEVYGKFPVIRILSYELYNASFIMVKDFDLLEIFDSVSSVKRILLSHTSLAAKGALANHLQRRTACKFQNGRQGAPKWQRGSGKVSTPRFLGVLSNFR